MVFGGRDTFHVSTEERQTASSAFFVVCSPLQNWIRETGTFVTAVVQPCFYQLPVYFVSGLFQPHLKYQGDDSAYVYFHVDMQLDIYMKVPKYKI